MATTTTNNGWTIPQSTDLVSQGATAIATLGNGIDTSTGKGLIAWQSYTPTLGGITKGTGATELYHFCQLGKTVTVRLSLTLGTSGVLTAAPTFTLPVTASANASTVGSPIGLAQFSDASPATENYGFVYLSSTTVANLLLLNAAGTYATFTSPGATVPWTWAINDKLRAQFTYEAA
jgi:hypothetical protein